MTTPLLSAQGLCHAWPGHTLFDQLSFALQPGLTLLLGGDGSRKTTLLRLLSGTESPQKGSVHWHADANGQDVRHTVLWLHSDDPTLQAWNDTPARQALHAQLQTWPKAKPQ